MTFRNFFLLSLVIFNFNVFSKDFKILEKKIYQVISRIEESNLVFIRNSDEHSAKDASAHIKRKFEFAKKSPFTPSLKKWTFDYFIKEIASKSSSSGEAYKVRDNEGKIQTMESWIYSLEIK